MNSKISQIQLHLQKKIGRKLSREAIIHFYEGSSISLYPNYEGLVIEK